MKNVKTIASSAAAVLVLGGCAHNVASLSEATKPLEGAVKTSERFVSPAETGKVSNEWVATFNDPILTDLVKEAQAHNPDLTVAAARVERAAALMRLSESGIYPRVDIKGSFTDRDGRKKDRAFFGPAVSWEPDIWGRVANLTASDAETMRAMAADYAWARQSLAADTARIWFRLNADRLLKAFMDEVVGIQEKALKVAKERESIGAGTQRDVHMVAAMTEESREMRQSFTSKEKLDAHALAILVGRYPDESITPKKLVPVPAPVPSGIPADLLNRRPDLIAARYRVAAAFHNEKAMELLKLPSFRFSFQAGYDHVEDTIAKLVGSLFMPVIDNGRIDARIAAATAEQKAAIAQYRATVLRAYRETEDALTKEKGFAIRYDYLSKMEKEYKKAYEMTMESYQIGEGTIIDVLIAQGKWIDAKVQRVQMHLYRLANRVNLHLALGGSFDAKPAWNTGYSAEKTSEKK
ncbi:TolC family protein [Hydrogenimonas urashimensis]|uniref:TolC family protein n=1 Tax=Hydrogenimonas urashimensis TaxID=2740515 RepID=UPI0019151120|nr:efflux transporter outer membrane subunit [Hydrogenimonas urashimensis]